MSGPRCFANVRLIGICYVVVSKRHFMCKPEHNLFKFTCKYHRISLMDTLPSLRPPISCNYISPSKNLYHGNHRHQFSCKTHRISAVDEVSAVTFDPGAPDITWQIVVGSIAGVTPFVVAGIEFSKRIVAQKKCNECGGSGLVLIEDEYIRCPNCGGFLPWQSWRRFFSG
ncbi:hypothetical protein Hdeb2414_s0001g00016471 [Helianthus debilis subsp. tardiflorus]